MESGGVENFKQTTPKPRVPDKLHRPGKQSCNKPTDRPDGIKSTVSEVVSVDKTIIIRDDESSSDGLDDEDKLPSTEEVGTTAQPEAQITSIVDNLRNEAQEESTSKGPVKDSLFVTDDDSFCSDYEDEEPLIPPQNTGIPRTSKASSNTASTYKRPSIEDDVEGDDDDGNKSDSDSSLFNERPPATVSKRPASRTTFPLPDAKRVRPNIQQPARYARMFASVASPTPLGAPQELSAAERARLPVYFPPASACRRHPLDYPSVMTVPPRPTRHRLNNGSGRVVYTAPDITLHMTSPGTVRPRQPSSMPRPLLIAEQRAPTATMTGSGTARDRNSSLMPPPAQRASAAMMDKPTPSARPALPAATTSPRPAGPHYLRPHVSNNYLGMTAWEQREYASNAPLREDGWVPPGSRASRLSTYVNGQMLRRGDAVHPSVKAYYQAQKSKFAGSWREGGWLG